LNKGLNRNGKVNQFLTDIGVVSVEGFEISLLRNKKVVTQEFFFEPDIGMQNDVKYQSG